MFYILLVEQNITKKEQVNKNRTKFNIRVNNKKYKFEAIKTMLSTQTSQLKIIYQKSTIQCLKRVI